MNVPVLELRRDLNNLRTGEDGGEKVVKMFVDICRELAALREELAELRRLAPNLTSASFDDID